MPPDEPPLARRRVGGALRVVVCLDDVLLPLVRTVLDPLGFRIVGETDRGLQAVALAGETGTDLIVLDLALTGTLGLRLIPVLLAAAPGAVVVALSPAATLDVAALEAGAHAVVGDRDVRRLRAVLSDLATQIAARPRR